MSYDVPHHYEPQIEQVALAQHITIDEALDRIIQAGLVQFGPSTLKPNISYASLFGAAKNGYGSREAVDRAIAEMRDEW